MTPAFPAMAQPPWAGKPEEDEDGEAPARRKHNRTPADVQRAKLEKLMKNPDKPVHIPTPKTAKDPNRAPDFVYNVMGSSAGAGSGEFHVYRQIRRKETLRMKVLGSQQEKDELNEAYHQKLDENERLSEERTAKKRQKRQKKKEAQKRKKLEQKKKSKEKNKNGEEGDRKESSSSSGSSSESSDDDDDDKKTEK